MNIHKSRGDRVIVELSSNERRAMSFALRRWTVKIRKPDAL